MFTFVRLRLLLAPGRRSLPPFHLFSLASRLEDACRGSALFEALYGRRIPDDPVAVKRFQKPSSPLVLTPPLLGPLQPSASLPHLDVALIGSSTVHAGPVIARLVSLLQGDYAVNVVGAGLTGVYEQQQISLGDLCSLEEPPLTIVTLDDLTRQLEAAGAGAGVCLQFAAPLKIVRQGRALMRITGADVLRALLRRISSLAYHYCHYEFPVDYHYLSELAAGIAWDSSGLFPCAGARGEGEGVMGELVLSGNLEPFLPFLAAGSVVHLGKGAAGGYGCYGLRVLA